MSFYESQSNANTKKQIKKQESLLKKLFDFCEELNLSYCIDEMGESYALFQTTPTTPIKIQSDDFKKRFSHDYFFVTHESVPNETMTQLSNLLEQSSLLQGKHDKKIFRRIGMSDQGFIYYSLANQNGESVRITSNGYEILTQSEINFLTTKNTKTQFDPQSKGKLKHITQHFRFKHNSDKLLFLTYLVTCLIPNIPHPILILSGDKGAAKSTTLRMVRTIIDPANSDLLRLPNKLDDLITNLGNNYMCCFDNLSQISEEQSNLLCMASTGGTMAKRKLYSDSDEVLINIKRCIALNGINLGGLKPDLLDRSLVFELGRIPTDERKTEDEVWNAFYADIPYMLDWCFSTLSKALTIYPSLELKDLPRMADFAKWGYSIAEAMGIGGDAFLTAYEKNQKRLNEDIITFNLVANVTSLFMKNRPSWSGSWTDLYSLLEKTAIKHNIKTHYQDWPKGINTFSRSLSDVKTDLERIGIFYNVVRGKSKVITLTNENVKNENC